MSCRDDVLRSSSLLAQLLTDVTNVLNLESIENRNAADRSYIRDDRTAKGSPPLTMLPAFNSETLASRVCSALRKEILNGEVRPGERLSENAIAGRLGVSATPVREAVRLLVSDGLVEYVDRKGVRVIDLNAEQIRQAFAVRNSLERQALAEALPRMTKMDKERLVLLAHQAEEAQGQPASLLFEIDRAFHAFFVERSTNSWLTEFSARMSNVLTIARLELFAAPALDAVIAEHCAIAAAVRQGNLATADRELNAHIRRVCENAVAAHTAAHP